MSADDDQSTSPSRPDELAALQDTEDAERRRRVLALTAAVLAEHSYILERLREL
jgi:hypothetical protein